MGNDLLVTNSKTLKERIEHGIAHSILIKFNRIGSLYETLKAIRMAQQAGYTAGVSHRMGKTEDANLAVMTSVGQIKTGSLCHSDQVGKYNAPAHRGRFTRASALPCQGVAA